MTTAAQKKQPTSLEVRNKLLDDPTTQEIASNLGLTLETYVEQVVHYYTNPSEQPILQVVSDEDLAEAGVDVPSEEEIVAWLERVASGEIEPEDAVNELTKRIGAEHRALIGGKESERLEARGVEEAAGQVVVGDDPAGAILKSQQLQQKLRTTTTADWARRAATKRAPARRRK